MGLQLLKEAREEKYTQAEIAEILGVKRGTYASWECGSDIIPAKQIYTLGNIYKMSTDYLLGISPVNRKIKGNELNLDLIGQRLFLIRKNLRMSQLKIAESIGINQSTWWAYEKGKNLITTSTLVALAKRYGYSTDYILGRCKDKFIKEKSKV